MSFSVLEMMGHIRTKETTADGECPQLGEFRYFDSAGRLLEPVDEPMQLHYLVVSSEDSTDHRDKIKSQVSAFFHKREPQFGGDFYFDQIMGFMDEDIDFELFAWRLAALMRDHADVPIPGVVFRQSQSGKIFKATKGRP